MAYRRDYTHYSRRCMFGGASGEADITLMGRNWSAASFVMTIAATEGGAALITLTNQSAGTQGLSATYDAGYVHPVSGEVVGATILRPQIDEATLEGLDYGTPAAAKAMKYDLLVTPTGEPQRAVQYGDFVVELGVGD